MKKAFGLAVVLLSLSWSLSSGNLQIQKARYLGNPRITPLPEPAWHNFNGRGPVSFGGPATFLDSSANQNGIYVSRINGTSSDGNLIVGKVIRQMVPGSGWLENFTWTNGGNPPGTFTADPNLNTGNYARYPWSQFDAPDRYGFVTAAQVVSGEFAQPMYIRNSGGYGSGLWYTPLYMPPPGGHYGAAMGFWVGDVSPYHICVLMEATSGGMMSEVIDTLGNEVDSSFQTIFDLYGVTADCRNGRITAFGADSSDGMDITTSTDGGFTWTGDSMGIWSYSADSGYWECNNVILQDGSVGVLLTMDQSGHSWDGHNTPHGALQFFRHNALPPNNKTTIFSPGPTQAATFPMISRKGDNTLMATFMYKESGWDSIAWSNGQTMWDIGESHSTDGGLTWSAVRNLTNTPWISECCVQTAKHIGSNNRLHMTYGTAAVPTDPVDIYWNAEFNAGAQETYNWYFHYPPDTDAVMESKSFEVQNPTYGLSPVKPNPMRGAGAISYQLPKPSRTTLVVYNSLGQRVRTLRDGVESAGRFTASWDARDEAGLRVSPGVFFLRLCSGSFTRVREVVVVR